MELKEIAISREELAFIIHHHETLDGFYWKHYPSSLQEDEEHLKRKARIKELLEIWREFED